MFLIFGMEDHEEGGGANDYICSKDDIESAILECRKLLGTSPKQENRYSAITFDCAHAFDTSTKKIIYSVDVYGGEELNVEFTKLSELPSFKFERTTAGNTIDEAFADALKFTITPIAGDGDLVQFVHKVIDNPDVTIGVVDGVTVRTGPIPCSFGKSMTIPKEIVSKPNKVDEILGDHSG